MRRLLDAGLAVLVGLALWAVRRISPGRLASEVGVNAVRVFGVGYLVAFRFLLILALAGWDVPGCVWMG